MSNVDPKMLHKLPDFTASREAMEKLSVYKDQLGKWQKAVNLVSPATLSQSDLRHFKDSLQIAPLIDENAILLDLGSGAGFPGLVLASLETSKCHLVESDIKKCQFLKNVSREANIPVTIHNSRIENVEDFWVDIITARALADIKTLLSLCEKWWSKNKKIKIILLKGETVEQEILQAKNLYNFDYKLYQSETDSCGRIIMLTSIARIP